MISTALQVRAILSRVVTAAVSTAATLLAIEAATRIAAPRLWWPDRHGHPPAVSPVHPAPRPGPAVLLLGDSFAYGSGIARWEDTLSGQLSAALGVPVINRGVPGSQTWRWRKEAERACGERPWLAVVVSWCYRDGAPLEAGYMASIRAQEMRVRYPSLLITWLADRYARRAYTRAALDWTAAGYRPGMPEWEAAQEHMVAIEVAMGRKPLLVTWPVLLSLSGDYPLGEYHEAMREFAARVGWPSVDLLPAFKGRDERTLWASPTDQHPNPEAVRIAVGQVEPEVRRTMR